MVVSLLAEVAVQKSLGCWFPSSEGTEDVAGRLAAPQAQNGLSEPLTHCLDIVRDTVFVEPRLLKSIERVLTHDFRPLPRGGGEEKHERKQ